VTSRTLSIVVTCDWFAPRTGGGAERVAFEVTRRLAADGHRIAIVATSPPAAARFDLPDGVELIDVRAHDLAGLIRAQASVAPALVTATRRVIARVHPDVVWGHSLQFQSTPIAAAWARRAGIPFVVTAHIGDLRSVPGLVGRAARVHEATIGHAILRLAARALAVSEPVATHLRSIEPRLAIDVVPNGVDVERFGPGDALPGERLHVGFLGRLVRNKGPESALHAVAAVVRDGVDASISFAGDGPERARLERLAATLGIGDRAGFEGFRSDPEVWLRGIDVLVRPSTTEGMPLGVLEAMAAGVPVIASDVPGNAALIRDGESGLLFPVGHDGALAGALGRISRDDALRARIRDAGLRIAREHSWDQTAALTLRGLEKAIVGRPVAAPAAGVAR
jgi:glycosyltransferase involved in cell wall biosynthesis